jgi:hypothetical protein
MNPGHNGLDFFVSVAGRQQIMPLDDTNWSQPVEVIDETTTLLIRARSFLERGWCRDTLARDAWGNEVSACGDRAAKWCINGALLAAGFRGAYVSHPAVARLEAAIDGEDLVEFNNQQETVEPILAAFDRAIAARDR